MCIDRGLEALRMRGAKPHLYHMMPRCLIKHNVPLINCLVFFFGLSVSLLYNVEFVQQQSKGSEESGNKILPCRGSIEPLGGITYFKSRQYLLQLWQ